MQELYQRPSDPHVKRPGLNSRKWGSRVVEHDEVDVARIVELACPHLAHGQHDVAGAFRGAPGVGDLELAAALRIREQVIDRAADRDIGELGLPLDDLHHRPNPADVGERNQQRGLRFHAPKETHDFGFIVGRRDRTRCVGENIVEAALGFSLEQRNEPLRVRLRKLPEIPRALRQAHDEPIEHGVGRKQLGQRLPPGCIRDLGEPLAHTRTGLARGGKMLRGSDALRERTGLVVGAFDRPRRRRIHWHPGSISICQALRKRAPRPP